MGNFRGRNQYDEVIFQDGSDDLPPGVSEGVTYYKKEELKMKKRVILSALVCFVCMASLVGCRRQEDLQNGRKNGV